MKRTQQILTALVALWWMASGCHPAQKVSYTPDNIVPTDQSLLWRISGNGLKQPSYLFGTIHMIPKKELQFSEATLNALNRSKKIIFEVDMKEMTSFRTQFSVLNKAFMKGGKTLKDLLPPDEYALVHQKIEDKGLPAGMFERMKPLFLSTLLSSDESENPMDTKGNSSMTAVEMELWKIAKKQKMKSGGLETADYQLSIFDAIPYEDQAKMLVEGLQSAEDTDDQLQKMFDMYKAQDINGMQNMIGSSEGMSEHEDILLGQRNRNWIPKMKDMMPLQTTFFAVGAGHLGGPNGVIALLRKEGFLVEAIK